MLPSLKQYMKWSLPSKYGFIGVLIAFVSLIPLTMALKNWMLSVPDYASLAFNYGESEMTIYGAEGESTEEAVIIRGANTEEAGVRAEYYWIKRRYPGYERISQAVYKQPKDNSAKNTLIIKDAGTGIEMEIKSGPPVKPRIYDVLYLRNWYGMTKDIHFDITSFINKGSEPRAEYVHDGPTLNDFIEAVNRKMENKVSKENLKEADPPATE